MKKKFKYIDDLAFVMFIRSELIIFFNVVDAIDFALERFYF